jgi:hypothetical protein
MAEKEQTGNLGLHKRFGIELNNLVWTMMDKPDRTPEEDEQMLHAAHASCYHWLEAGTPVNHARGVWLISRVYAVLGKADPALHYAKRCLEICEANGIADFDIAFAYEALARAHAVGSNEGERDKHLQLAQKAGEAIAGEEDRKIFFGDLASVPGYVQP